ncbi:Oxygen-dependent choline dehydrogenase [Lecanosticta acicola]|uniref:Oxygen-dependent choline dehydrogenase n=1 Tax=Lecanosticta acicola TaxID=111012 RepID=A0AAI9EBS0_9PEZI|nr:Oxygen-dependent choline dehydrogenase [Lecanosticta acicola]
MLLKGFAAVLSIATAAVAVTHGHGHFHHRRTVNATSYEYVIVGSGPGGGPLAARLALAGHTVLLIEAGGDNGESLNQTVPTWSLKAGEDDAIKWDYWVSHYEDLERQKRDSKMTYRKTDGSYYVGLYPPAGAVPLGILYPRTGTLGGCAEHNAMITTYPNTIDWEGIQNITGDDTWAPDNMRTYFEKLERIQYAAGAGHGTDGWLRTSLTNLVLVLEDTKLLSCVVSAATAMGKGLLTSLITTVTSLGHVLLDDLNSNSPLRDQTADVYQVPLAIDQDTSTRSSPRKFVLEVANATNSDGSRKYHLDIALHTLATKIRFDQNGTTPRATGIEYRSGEHLYSADPNFANATGTYGYVAATKDVIISAGTFNTPQLLKLSGVGPREELESFGIPVVKELPGVGTNMQDRYEISIVEEASSKFSVSKDCTFLYDGRPDPCLVQWQTGLNVDERGPYTTSGAALGVVLKSSTAAETDPVDTFILGTPGVFNGFFPNYAYNSAIWGNRWSWLALKAHSHNNAGTVTLRSRNPHDVPHILFRSFDTGNTTDGGDEKDVQALYEGLLWGRSAFDKLISLDGTTWTELSPGGNITTEAQLKQYIKDEAWGHHACCTAAIGADDDPSAVLDTNFRVRGIDGLRVVDASIFPKIPGAFIALSIYIISEKAADVIINGS